MGQRGLQAAENRLAMFHKGEEEGGGKASADQANLEHSVPLSSIPHNTSFPSHAILSPITSIPLQNHRNLLFIHLKSSDCACLVVGHMKK